MRPEVKKTDRGFRFTTRSRACLRRVDLHIKDLLFIIAPKPTRTTLREYRHGRYEVKTLERGADVPGCGTCGQDATFDGTRVSALPGAR